VAKIQNNAEDLQKFATRFDSFLDVLCDQTSKTVTSFERLGDSWKDEQYKRMGEKIDAFGERVGNFISSMEDIPTYLRKLADEIGGFEGTR